MYLFCRLDRFVALLVRHYQITVLCLIPSTLALAVLSVMSAPSFRMIQSVWVALDVQAARSIIPVPSMYAH